MSASVNKAILIGNLTRDVEMRSTTSGHSVANFSLATNSVWKDASGNKQERVEYHNVVVWGKLAEICNQYLAKGSKVYIEGRLQTRDWEAQDGAKKQRTEIVAEQMVMLDRKPQGSAPAESRTTAVTPAPAQPSYEPEIRTEDIPF